MSNINNVDDSTGDTCRQGVSMNPDEFAENEPDKNLMEKLLLGEYDEDFLIDADGRREKCPRRNVDTVVTGMLTAIDEFPPRFVWGKKVNKNAIYQVATKQGLSLVRGLDEYKGLPKLYEAQLKLSRGRDRSALGYLERREPFKFPHRVKRTTGISIYHWVASELGRTAKIAGLPDSAVIVATVLLALSTMPDWAVFFKEDLDELRNHLRRRKRMLDGAL